jgi:hypothetical protein
VVVCLVVTEVVVGNGFKVVGLECFLVGTSPDSGVLGVGVVNLTPGGLPLTSSDPDSDSSRSSSSLLHFL